MVLRVFIERETHNFILKFREMFPWRETGFRANGMRSDENQFFCQIYAILWEKKKIVHFVIHIIFLYSWRVLKIFLNQWQSLIVGILVTLISTTEISFDTMN